MDAYCIKLFSFAFTLFCLSFWTCRGATSAAVHLPQPSSSALLAAETLRSRGYSLFASAIVSLSLVSANFSGTILAPPDFTFSSATAMFLNNRRPTPRPSITLLLYHTLKPPLVLTWTELSSRDDGDELRTLYNNNCLYVSRNPFGGDVMIASSPFKNPLDAVQIRQPDLYVDDHLTVHGIDGVLDPSYATMCGGPPMHGQPTVQEAPRRVNLTYLDHAMRGLRRAGYGVVAAAMAVRRVEMLSLTTVTVFAVSDKNLFLKPDGFRFDFRHHVVPTRYGIEDLTIGMELVTLAPMKTLIVDSVNGVVTVNGVAVDAKELYRSKWITVLSIVTTFDDVTQPRDLPVIDRVSEESAHSPPPFSVVSRVPSPAPSYAIPRPTPVNSPTSSTDLTSIATPPVSDFNVGITIEAPNFDAAASGQLPAPEMEAPLQTLVNPPAPSPAAVDNRCVVAVGVEGSDLFCPEGTVRRLQEAEDLTGEHVEGSQPSNAYTEGTEYLTQLDDVRLADNVNIADDIFFYT